MLMMSPQSRDRSTPGEAFRLTDVNNTGIITIASVATLRFYSEFTGTGYSHRRNTQEKVGGGFMAETFGGAALGRSRSVVAKVLEDSVRSTRASGSKSAEILLCLVSRAYSCRRSLAHSDVPKADVRSGPGVDEPCAFLLPLRPQPRNSAQSRVHLARAFAAPCLGSEA